MITMTTSYFLHVQSIQISIRMVEIIAKVAAGPAGPRHPWVPVHPGTLYYSFVALGSLIYKMG